MEPAAIESAYAPFVAMLRGGGFSEPEEGWQAELVAAHVASNNDMIAEVAEQIAAGEEPTYDNAEAVNEDALRDYATRLGSLAAQAEAVEASARRLAEARAALDDTNEGYLIPARILDGGEVVNDGPIPIGRFIDGNASFHLDLHFEQLKALRR